jgi:NAD(P)-dependent dehydrogenase (short-subunit alcohol dehydrogenase family)
MAATQSLRAIVTGASRGIGRAVAARLLDDGWEVYNLDLSEPETEPGLGDRWIRVDLGDIQSTREALAAVLDDGPVTGLVNNAAIGRMASLEETSVEDYDLSVHVNMRGPMLCAQALAPGMKARGFGRIVNISSRAHLGKTLRTSYAATKGAMVSMTKVWALELAGHGITVNAIAPGPVRTELFEKANPPHMPRTQQIIDSIPAGRLGEPADIANTVAFFFDKRSGYVTGQVLYVCGGVTLARGGS